MKDIHEYSKERRLHPLTIVYRGIVSLPQFAIVLYFAFSQGRMEEWVSILISFLYLFIAFPFIALNYFYFSFFINPHEIVIKSGVFSRRVRHLPLNKIQNIEVTQNLLQRILGLAKVMIETAGDIETEGHLEFVSKKDAENISAVIRDQQSRLAEMQAIPIDPANQAKGTIKGKEPSNEEELLFSMSLIDNVRQGMLSFRPWLIFIVFWVFTTAQQFYLIPDIETTIDKNFISIFEGFNSFYLAIFIIIGLIISIILSWLIDILITVINFYGFKLSLVNGKLFTEQGLFSRRKGTIPIKKLQSMIIKSNFIRRYFDLWSLDLETAGFSLKIKRAEIAVPLAPKARIIELASRLKPFIYPDEFRKVSKKTIKRAIIKYLLVIVIPYSTICYLVPEFLWLLFLSPILYFFALINYRYRGYYLDDSWLIIRQGYFIQRITLIPIEKIQSINIVQSFFQRRLNLSSLFIDTAATGSLADASIIDIEDFEADSLAKEINNKLLTKIYENKPRVLRV
jgi:putative membrane protein